MSAVFDSATSSGDAEAKALKETLVASMPQFNESLKAKLSSI